MGMQKVSSTGAMQLCRVMEEFLRRDENLPVAASLIFLHVAANTGRDGPTLGDIAKATGLSESRVSRNVNTLEDMGLVRKDRDPANFRQKFVNLTEVGDAFLAKLTGFISATN